MSKRLLLMRHAKSSWKEPLPDRERPLNKRGKRAARLIGEALAERGIIPDRILSSDAKRARATAKRVLKALPENRTLLQLDPALYAADAETILREIGQTDDQTETLLVIAHNPGISETAVALSGDESYEWLPTAAVVGIEFDTDDWKKVGERKGKVVFYAAPKAIEKR